MHKIHGIIFNLFLLRKNAMSLIIIKVVSRTLVQINCSKDRMHNKNHNDLPFKTVFS